ncbi:MAG: hypothetical protein IJ071_05430 [Ruminococcus sp.]|nr:hypothetical protein [Ruminococcus sp.]
MLHIGRTERSYTVAFLIFYLMSAVVSILVQLTDVITGLSSVMYCFFVIAWGASVFLRIVHKRIRRDVIAIAFFLFGLFAVRICRYFLFLDTPVIDRCLWYLYYIPYIAMPMLTLDAAYCVGKGEGTEPPVTVKVLWAVAILLMAGVLTNDLHHFLLSFGDMKDLSGTSRYNWLYFLVVAWSTAATLGAFLLLIKRCRLSQSRKYWYIPVVTSLVGAALIVVYYAIGGSPQIGGIRLYYIQEVFVLLFVGLWEGCIKIGLIPSNTGYSELFERSHIDALLQNADGRTVYRSKGHADTAGSDNLLVRRQPIKGGWVVWREDISAIERINEDLEEATERIEEENDLIEEENRLTAEKVRYETQNRLYDNIAAHTHSQLVEIDEALSGTDEFDLRMKFCLLLGTYVKRCSNLMLIADTTKKIPVYELALSIKESFEYMGFLDIDCELIGGEEGDLPSEQIIAAYDLFEKAIESVLDRVSACLVRLLPSEGAVMTIDMDSICPDPKGLITVPPGLKISAYVEDETQRIALSVGGADDE